MKSWVTYKGSSSGWVYWKWCRCYRSWIGKSYQINYQLSIFIPSIYI